MFDDILLVWVLSILKHLKKAVINGL